MFRSTSENAWSQSKMGYIHFTRDITISQNILIKPKRLFCENLKGINKEKKKKQNQNYEKKKKKIVFYFSDTIRMERKSIAVTTSSKLYVP